MLQTLLQNLPSFILKLKIGKTLYYYVIVRLKTNINISRTKSQIYIAVVNLYLLV